MKLFTGASTQYARDVIDVGFVGVLRYMYDPDELEAAIAARKPGEFVVPPESIGTAEYVEMRDMPPSELTLGRTTEIDVTGDEDEHRIDVTFAGPVLADDLGDFVLCIDVPDDVAAEFIVHDDINEVYGFPYREFWLSPEAANRYRDTLVVFDADDGEVVRPDLVGK